MALSLTDLPYTIFTTIITHLSPTQTILCRRLSRAFLSALTRADLCISLILCHFPRSLEGRRLRTYLKTGNLAALESGDWAAVFARLARRYYHLGNALPWKVEKVAVLKDEEVLRGVEPWDRHLSLNGKTAAFHFWDPVWTVAPKEGLLVYPAPSPSPSPSLLEGEDDDDDDKGASAGGAAAAAAARYCYRARDLQTGREVDVPFDLRGRIVRRVRISHGVLVFEWCEREPLSSSRSLVGGGNEETTTTEERVHRHYATAYSVRRTGSWDGVIPRRHTDAGVAHDGSSEMPTCSWEFELCCELKIHPVGLSLDHHDRFFSTHNATHYAVYTWQPPPRSFDAAWPDDEPLESLTIWEFNPPNSYSQRPDAASSSSPPTTSSPRIIRTLNNAQLRAFAILQHDAPALRAMALDDSTWDAARASACGHVFFTEEEHRWSAGPHSRPSRPRLHRVKTTGIPLVGAGPRWVDDCGGGGGVNLRFCWRGRWRRDMTEMEEDEDDDNDGDGEASVGGTDDDDDGDDDKKRGIWSPERAWSHSQTWPGRAPCWRHDDFPYVTLSEVFDAAAGVRVIARDCFMLETLSVHIRPKIRVQGVGPNGAKLVSRRASSGTDTKKTTRTFTNTATPSPQIVKNSTTTTAITAGERKSTATITSNTAARTSTSTSTTTTTQGPDGHEVQFADAMWSEMMGKGFICGDERWLVGEDIAKGDVTILVF
ncbi:uncharacterized protein TRIREDRAFT_119607 [Trichoderma reesei QM6a]|jgi:hypothetical protein|uniref:Predicted protein n=2 Tax=Hypocrea jecorina TaxID=51453 RepID=G0R722_HYPJQ|nr:uncharacterized protein TRIREDRAFT_119607 [Trichoderma reesei QM6a]EGR52203.1 predicted protein [Trichoderma reesei QM6a]ETS06331.1 hypothetical protein M419DRAFT_135284 [Trichoderma reesei RUT C-30]